jgi:hypothetical protein
MDISQIRRDLRIVLPRVESQITLTSDEKTAVKRLRTLIDNPSGELSSVAARILLELIDNLREATKESQRRILTRGEVFPADKADQLVEDAWK